MIDLEVFFINNSFKFFTYHQNSSIVKLQRGVDNENDTIIFSELKSIVNELMNLPVDFHILDNGDIEIEEL